MRLVFLFLLFFSPLPAFAQTLSGAMDAVLVLHSADGRDRFLGSGFVFGDARTVVTNEHVVGDADAVLATTRDGRRIRASVVKSNADLDIAILKLEEPAGAVLQAASGSVDIGHAVFAAGAPLEAGFSLTAGIVSMQSRQVDPKQPVLYIQHSAAVNPGSSGGPLMNAEGKVLGVNTRIADGSRFFVGIAYAVPIAEVMHVLTSEGETNKTPPGMKVRPLDTRIRQALSYDGTGVLVDHVATGAPAHAAGIRAGDILVELDGMRVSQPGDIAVALRQAGQRVEAQIIRAGRPVRMTLNLTAGTQPLTPMGSAAVSPKTEYTLAEMGITADDSGLISAMAEDGAGFFSGLSPDDRILAIDGVQVADMDAGWSTQLAIQRPTLLLIALPDGSTQHYVLDPWNPHTGFRPSSGANVLDQEVVSFE